MLYAFISLIFADILVGFAQMTADMMFGLKVVALVMLYGYMHINLGSGLISAIFFLIFGYYFVFYAHGMMAIIVLACYYLMIHGFDIMWGGDIIMGWLR